jgi:hypothetical protein
MKIHTKINYKDKLQIFPRTLYLFKQVANEQNTNYATY